MIIDTIENLKNYVGLNPLFAEVVDFLKVNDLQTLEPGKYPIKGDDVYLNLQVAKQRTMETAFLETHIKMIDIQIPISCAETFGYTPLKDLPDCEYDAENDITKYGDTKAQDYITLDPGLMVIFFPEDGHAPCIIDEPEIKKAIFKVKV
jgi:YhcH/YjgK/YiaL family protein